MATMCAYNKYKLITSCAFCYGSLGSSAIHPSTHPARKPHMIFPPAMLAISVVCAYKLKTKEKDFGMRWVRRGRNQHVMSSLSCKNSNTTTHKLCRSLPSQNRAIKVGRQQVRGGVGKRQNQMLTISIIISEPTQNTQPRHANYWRFAVRFVSFPHLNLVYQIQVDAWFSHFKILIVYRTNLKIKFPTGYN